MTLIGLLNFSHKCSKILVFQVQGGHLRTTCHTFQFLLDFSIFFIISSKNGNFIYELDFCSLSHCPVIIEFITLLSHFTDKKLIFLRYSPISIFIVSIKTSKEGISS
jgi:hypothetical protein